MATEQHIGQYIVKPPDLKMDHRKIVTIVRKLASVPFDEQRGREALQSLIELSAEVDEMIKSGPLSEEMKRDISLVSLRYTGQNLYWNAKNVTSIPTLQFHDLLPYIGCLTKSNENERERILRPAFLKVELVFFIVHVLMLNKFRLIRYLNCQKRFFLLRMIFCLFRVFCTNMKLSIIRKYLISQC